MSGELRVSDEGPVRWLTIQRPERRNALTQEVLAALRDAFHAAADADSARVVVLTGSGGSFSSGLDLKSAGELMSAEGGFDGILRTHFHALIRAIAACPKPVIAMVDGAAAGFGCDLAVACDLRLCSDRAKFGEIFVKRGLMPDGGATFTLPRLIGLGRTLELMLTGDQVDAPEALRIGLANRVWPAEQLEEQTRRFASELALGPPKVHRWVKRAVYGALDSTLDAALDAERQGQVELLQSKDFLEGFAAFLEKRPPRFTGE